MFKVSFERYRSALLIAAFVGVGALILTFGTNSSVHDADSVLPALMSIQKLTFYYWDQNRFANLLPLLAAPIRDAEANLYFQIFLRNAFAFGSIAFVLLLMTNRDYLFVRFLFATIVIMIGAPRFSYFGVAIPHGTSCALFAIGLYTLERTRHAPIWSVPSATALALFAVSFFVNISLIIIVMPISFGSLLIGRYGPKTVIGRPATFFLIAVAAVIAQLHSSFFEPKTPSTLRYSPDGLAIAAKAIIDQLDLNVLLVLFLGCLFAASLSYFKRRRPAEIRISGNDTLLLAVVFGTTLLLVNISWVHINGYAVRYFNVNLLILLVMFASWCIEFLKISGVLQYSRITSSALTVAAIAAVCWTAAAPTRHLLYISGVPDKETEINSEIPQLLNMIEARTPAILVGDYWYIVPAAFERMKATGRFDTYALPNNIGGGHGGPVKAMLGAFLPSATAVSIMCIGISSADCIGRLQPLGLNGDPRAPVASGKLSAGEYLVFELTQQVTTVEAAQ